MSLRKAHPANIPYKVYPSARPREVQVEIPRHHLEHIYRRLQEAESPKIAFQDDQGAMFMDAFRLREKIIKEVLLELEAYV